MVKRAVFGRMEFNKGYAMRLGRMDSHDVMVDYEATKPHMKRLPKGNLDEVKQAYRRTLWNREYMAILMNDQRRAWLYAWGTTAKTYRIID